MKNSFQKKLIVFFLSIILGGGLTVANLAAAAAGDKDKGPGCATSGEDVKKETAEAVATIKQYAAEQRGKALVKARQYMDQLDKRIEKWEQQLNANWDQMSESARENWRTSIKTLQKERNDLSEWYGGMKHSSNAAWEEIKKGFSDAYMTVADSLTKAQGKFKAEK
jgi:small-conductance mechanosensitive channel